METATSAVPSKTRESVSGSGGSGADAHPSVSARPLGNGDLSARAAELTAELGALGLDAWRARYRNAAPHATAAPSWWEATATAEPLAVTVALELLAQDQVTGTFDGRAHLYLVAARAAVHDARASSGPTASQEARR